MPDTTQPDIQSFIDRWQASGASERANYQLFLSELCGVIGVEPPRPKTEHPHQDAYVFEKDVPSPHGTVNFIDLYKRGCFVLEAKQGSEKPANDPDTLPSEAETRRKKQRKKGAAVRGTKGWDTAMENARNQARNYCKNLTGDEIEDGRPPFILVVDVGDTIALYSEFSRSGGAYIPFPDPASHRIKLGDLRNADIRERLRQVWNDPMGLDPSRRSAKVTREIAARLAALAKSLEKTRDPEIVAHFLMRCIFTMFAEDAGLLPERCFTDLLDDMRRDPAIFKPMMEDLWKTMDEGGFSGILRRKVPRFNGGLFADRAALDMTTPQIELLLEAAKADWRDVEPAIFGTLLERALDPVERHKLGAHYTPRAYVERLVEPTVVEPLRAEWESVQAAALHHAESGRTDKAVAEVEAFHRRLTSVRVLDPACGSGNFLYVTLEHLKRLEGEVLNTLRDLGAGQMKLEMAGGTVSPEQFLGIEVNPRAAAIAELVLWIGHLQWHRRTRGEAPCDEPIVKDFKNIECRDAVLAWDAVEPLLDENGRPVTRWDGRTMKVHPVTGEAMPDETARTPVRKYVNPRKAAWPEADFVVGNPPFIGIARMREALGDGYAETLRRVYNELPESVDYVMYWWHAAAGLVRRGKLKRFGFITTNSLRQTFNRRVLQTHLNDKHPLSLMFVVPDHPWVDSADGAAVRISMTVGESGGNAGVVRKVVSENREDDADEKTVRFSEQQGRIQADLTVGADVSNARPLRANGGISNRGVQLIGPGFIVTSEQAFRLGLGRIPEAEKHIRRYLNGRDIAATPRNVLVIDLFGLRIEEVQARFPEIYQWIHEHVKPQRDQNSRKSYRENWWLHGEPRSNLRCALSGLKRYVATVETAKHRFFVMLDNAILPDNMLVAVALEDACFLGILSSKPHLAWALAQGGTLEDRPRYNKTRCFETFPFPAPDESQKSRIRDLAEQLDAHRKRQQAQHPELTLTAMYNVLEKLRTEEPLTAKEKTVHEQGLVGILKQIHDDLDAAVFDAYGWPANLGDEEILQKLVDLNAERAAEEADGVVRWLRPEYQAPGESQPRQAALAEDAKAPATRPAPGETREWPKALKDRVTAVRDALAAAGGPVGPDELAAAFDGRRTSKRLSEIGDILETLETLGQVVAEGGKYTAG